MGQESVWSDSEISILTAQWPTSTTCEEIGTLCANRTKNAVVAQANRMGLGPKPRPRVTRLIYSKQPSTPDTTFTFEAVEKVVPYEELDKGRCYWPVTDPNGVFGYCGDNCKGTYCERHRAQSSKKKAA